MTKTMTKTKTKTMTMTITKTMTRSMTKTMTKKMTKTITKTMTQTMTKARVAVLEVCNPSNISKIGVHYAFTIAILSYMRFAGEHFFFSILNYSISIILIVNNILK